MNPYFAMMIVQAFMGHQAKQQAAAAQRRAKHTRDLAIKKRLQGAYSGARQEFANTNVMRRQLLDAKSEAGVEARLNEMRVASSLKASGVPQGQSTKALSRNLEGEALRKESKFLAQLDQKKTELAMRDRNLQQQMDMAWLDAKAQIAGTVYGNGPGMGSLALGLGEAYFKNEIYEKQTA